MKHSVKKGLLTLAFVALSIAGTSETAHAKKKNYSVSPSTKPIIASYKKSNVYNKKTKNYQMLQSYLEKMEKNGGGTLTLKKGTYSICSTLYVPSNVTIKMKSGVVLRKTTSTGTKKVASSKIMFSLVKQKNATGKKIKGLKASKNVSFEGSGTVTINMGKVSGGIGIAMAHNNNVSVKKIQFKNRKGGCYIAVSGCKKVTVDSCKFYEGATVSGSTNMYAVRLEPAAKTVDTFAFPWSNLDGTSNTNITIKGSVFSGLKAGIGTLKYGEKTVNKMKATIFQDNIKITNNRFKDIDTQAIKPMVWIDVKITGNKFYRGDKTKKTKYGVLAKGISNMKVENNSFNYIAMPVELSLATNSGKGKSFASVSNTVSAANKTSLQNNTVYNADHYYVPMTNTGSEQRIAYFYDKNDNNLVVTEAGFPYREHYQNSGYYCDNTRDYFAFRSAMEQLEYTGGGTLTVKAGTYNLSNSIYVPSNVTIIFEEGVVLEKVAAKYKTSLTEPKSMFVLCNPSLSGKSKVVGGYNGAHDITFKGTGTTVINCNYKDNAIAMILGHCKNVTISGIRFAKYYGYHLIECNSSQNVTIENCSFSDFTPSATDLTSNNEVKDYKESVNIDGSDGKIGGFNYSWSNGDKTNCDQVTIRNNTFLNVGAAIGSHNYSAEGDQQLYHTNITIEKNTITCTLNSGIRVLNWKDTTITDNTIQNIGKDANGEYGTRLYGVYMRGVVNATVKNNTFNKNYYPICIYKSVKTGSAGYPQTTSQLTAENWRDMLNNKFIDCKNNKIRLSKLATDTEKGSSGELIGFTQADFPEDIKLSSKTSWEFHYIDLDAKPEETKTPEATEKPEETKTPEATEKPEETKTPEATEKPETTTAPEETKVPETTVNPA